MTKEKRREGERKERKAVRRGREGDRHGGERIRKKEAEGGGVKLSGGRGREGG